MNCDSFVHKPYRHVLISLIVTAALRHQSWTEFSRLGEESRKPQTKPRSRCALFSDFYLSHFCALNTNLCITVRLGANEGSDMESSVRKTSECELSKPAFQGAEHYRQCLVAVGGCSEQAWRMNFQICPIRRKAQHDGVPLPTPKQLEPETATWNDVFKRMEYKT